MEKDIVTELREPLPFIESYNGEYLDEDYILDLLERAACEIEKLRGKADLREKELKL